MNKNKIKISQFVINSVPNLNQNCLFMTKLLEFETCDVRAFLVISVFVFDIGYT